MKKIIAIMLAALMIIPLAACGGGNGGNGGENESQNDGFTVVDFNGEKIKLSYESHHYDLYYKENLSAMNSNTMGSFCEVTVRQDEGETAHIHLVYYAGKSVEEVMSESNYEYFEKTVSGIKYTCFNYDENGVPGHTYVYCYDGSTYTISFVSNYDMTSLEEGFMQNVRFEKAS